MTNSRLNLGLILFLFVLFTGMNFAFEVHDCGNFTEPGTYFLQKDITTGSGGSLELLAGEPFEYCLWINASNVVLDCKGFTITTDVDIGILVDDDDFLNQQTGIQIKNCTINNTRFGGIYTYEAEEVFITNNTLENNGRNELRGDLLSCTGGINILRGEPDEPYYNFIAYNTLVNNSMGICLNGRNTDGVQNTIITNNTISGSSLAGLVLVEGTRSNEIYNTTIFNNSYGIFLSDAPFNDFEDLNVSNNKYADIMADPVFKEDGFCTNDFHHVKVTGGNNLLVVDNPGMVINPAFLLEEGISNGVIPSTQLIICNDNITIEDVYMQGDPTYRNNGLFVMGEGKAYNITINNLTATNLMAGVYAQLARNITIQNSTFEDNQYGIIFNSVKKGDFSYNTFNENTASGIFGTTSPAYYFYFDSNFSPNYFYQVSDLQIRENVFTNTGYGPSMREAFPTMSGVPGGFVTNFVDFGTGSAVQLFLTKNVTVADNVINNASTFGIFAFYTSETNLSNNEINLINNITEFDPYLLEFGEPPEYEPMVNQLKEMLDSMPGTGIYLDGANMMTVGNVISTNVKGLVSSPIAYSIDTMLIAGYGGLFEGFLPSGKNYIINNEFTGTNIGLYLAGNFGDVVYHNQFLNYEYGAQVLSRNNVVVDNMFNTTNYFSSISELLPNIYNASEITEESFLIPFDRNILRGENTGGNYWGLTNGEGHSDTCLDISPEDGFCDYAFVLNGTNNTDYKPLAFFSVIDCVDDFECWISVDFGDGFFCNIETECEECDPACDEDQQCVYDPVLDKGYCRDIVKECIDLDDVKNPLKAPDGNITNEYGDVRYDSVEDIFYINNNTLLCKKTYTTSTNDIFIKMNGSYELDCNQGLTLDYYMESLTGNAIGIINHYSNVTINNCIFKNFKEGIISTPDPSGGLDTSYGNLLFEETLVSTFDSDVDAFRNMNLFGNYINGVFKVDNKWYMFAKGASRVYSNEDYSKINEYEWEVDTSKYFGVHLSDDKFVSYNNESLMLLDTDANPVWFKNFIEEEVEVCGFVVANVYEHPDTGNLYAFVLEEGDAGKTAKIIAYDVSTGDELWNFTPSAPLINKGKLVFDSEGNVVVPYFYMDDAEGKTEIFTLNYTTGDIIGESIYFPEDGNYPNGYYSYVFIDSDDYIYDFNLGISQQVKPKAEVSSNESVITLQKYNLTGEDYSNATFVVPYIEMGAVAEAENRRDVNVLFDGEYIYYTAKDSKTGTDRLYYKVFDLNLEEVASGEFKPNYENVEFSSYINENNEVEFLGYFVGNYSYTTSGYNFLAILNKSNDFEFTMLNPVYIQEDYELLAPVHEFVEIDSEGNSIVVGYERYPYASKVKLSKFDTEGTLLYNTTYTPNILGNVLPLDFLINDDGNYLIGGTFVNDELNEKYFVALFNSSDGSLIDDEVLEVNITGTDGYDLDLLELDDSYTIIVNSNWLYNLTKSDFTIGDLGPWGLATGGLELSVSGDYVTTVNIIDSGVLRINFYNINLEKISGNIDLEGSESTIENDLPYGVYSFISEGNNFTYVYFTNINDTTGDINSLFALLVNGTPTHMSEFEDLFIYDVKVNENGEVYILAQEDGDVKGVFVALAEANATGEFNLTTVSDLDYLLGTKLAVNNEFFTAVGQNVQISIEGGSFIIGNQDAYVYSESFEGESSWTHTVLGTSLSSDIEEMLANYYVDAGAVNMYPMGDNYLVSVLRMSPGEGDEPVVKPVFYEVDKYGNYDFLFAFDESYYPAKAIYIDDKIYVLMLNSTFFAETGESGGKKRSLNIGISNYVIYSFDKDGTVNWEVVTDMYNVDFSDFHSLWYFPEPMVYDEVTGKLVIAGASFEIVEVCNDKDPSECGPQPMLSNISMGTIDLDGNYASKDLSAELVEYGVQYPINLISGINLADDGYFIVGGMFAGDILNSYIIKTNKGDFDSPNVEWATTLINGTYEVECTGGWDELEGMKTDTISIRISKDGSKLYYVYDKKLYSYDVASSIPSVIVPTWVNSKHGFDMSANGSVMLVAIEELGTGNYTWYHANLTNPEDWTIVEGFDNITTGSGYSLVSSNGTTMVIGFDNGTIYRSENGASGPWVKKLDLPAGKRYGVPFMSGDGETVIISYRLEESEYLNISSDGGDTWGTSLWESLPDSFEYINEFKINEDGSKLLVLLRKGSGESAEYALYLYNISGETWQEIGDELSFDRVSFSYMGDSASSKILVTSLEDENIRLYLSEDDGITWNETQPEGNSAYPWDYVDMSLDGKMIVIYTEWVEGVLTQHIFLSNGEEVCKSGYVGDPYTYFPIKSFYSEDIESGVLFLTLTHFRVNSTTYNMESPGTLIVDSNNGETLFLFDSVFKKSSDKNGIWNSFMYTENYEGAGGVTGYFKVDSSKFTSLATMQSALILRGAIIVDNEEYILFDYEPTSYGVMAVGSHFVDGDDQMSSIVQGYSFKTDYSEKDLENITLSNNGILKNDDVLLIDLSSTDSKIDSLLIGRKDMKCAVRFWTINSMSGSLWFGQNLWWDDAGSFISIDSDDANAAAFNVPSRVRLSYTGPTPTSVVGSNESCTTRQCVLDTGANLTGIVLTCDTVRKYCEFKVSGWSSYTLGSVPGPDPDPDPDPSSKEDMRLIYNSDMCIGEEYEIKVTDKFDSTIPIKYADVTIYLNYDKKAELTTNNDGKVFFTPEKVGSYSLKVDATGDYRAIFLTENYKFTARDCSLSNVCPDPTKENYILVVDNPPFDCQYACKYTEEDCEEPQKLVNDALGCRCALLICPPKENYDLVVDDWPTCKYECAIDQAYCDTLGDDYIFNPGSCACDAGDLKEVELVVVPEYRPDPEQFILKDGEVCTGGTFTLGLVSGEVDFLSNARITVFDKNGIKMAEYENVRLSDIQPLYYEGVYTFVVSSPGYKASTILVEIVDCPEPDIEEPIITPVESSFWDDIMNFFRTSIKGGCEGFYFEGLPTILCDLVWVVVIVGSVGAAYLEPLKSRKVISLFTPSVVAIVLIPLMGAIAAAVVVYLAYNSKKHVEGKLSHEKEQMEAEIQKE